MNPGWLKGFSTLDTQFQDGKALNALGLCLKPTWILFIKPAWRLICIFSPYEKLEDMFEKSCSAEGFLYTA